MQDSANRLGNAVSPYLQQHRDNPVAWREWGAEAMREAAARDCPILLSVGYAACHWCHVMAHESFEDEETAALMNRLFVNVKVDREERPDVDQVYMTALQAMGEQGGWPMTMFLTPAGEPFWGGTYFPPVPAHGRPSFPQVLEAVAAAWRDKRTALLASAADTRQRLTDFLARDTMHGGDTPAGPTIAESAESVARMLDHRRGGMRGAPKFPNAPFMELVARASFPDGPHHLQAGFLTTLRALCQGGIYDHLGGGLARYATDERWLVPHFEKMLYDNAQFLRHLVWGWRATGDDLFRVRIGETVGWLRREMRLPDGAFAASLDADSPDAAGHSHEGAFYVWHESEIDAALGERAKAFKAAYGVTADGNFEGKNVLNRLDAGEGEPSPFPHERATLLALRERRTRPGRDDKVLADWNGLAVRALADVAVAFGDREALRVADEAFDAVLDAMTVGGRLRHAAREGRAAAGFALSSDYGALIAAAVSLFAASGNAARLAQADHLAAELERWHGDGEGGHFLPASDAADMILRPRGDGDDAVPGGTALVLEALAMLADVTGNAVHLLKAERAVALAEARAGRTLAAGIAGAADLLVRASQLVLVGDDADPDFEAMVRVANRCVDLNRITVRLAPGTELPPDLPIGAMRPERLPAAFLCRDRTCRPPVHDATALRDLLRPSV